LSGETARFSPESRASLSSLARALAAGVGCVKYQELLARFGSDARDDAAERAFVAHVPPDKRAGLLETAQQAFDDARRVGAELLLLGDVRYPAALGDLPDPPVVLWASGAIECLETSPVVAIVGTRRATAYGARVTREIATQLARAGAIIVSGMARGIDAEAHVGGLAGRTAAVLGTGIDIAYPAAHRALHAEIRARGVLITEQAPGCKATAGSFPERNRIIAALARMTIVVEAGRKSGALITAARALALDRIVAAVPGPIDVPQSAGSNELLRDGAQVITSAEDALALAGLTPPPRAPGADAAGPDRAIWDAVGAGAHDLDTITAVTALPAREVMAAVTRLELRGSLECLLTGEIRRR
jgi:DNA processing protein